MKGDREKCLEAGASDYIAKPVNTDQLLSLLRVLVAPVVPPRMEKLVSILLVDDDPKNLMVLEDHPEFSGLPADQGRVGRRSAHGADEF
ncbi:MAG: hypothetical protein WDN28_32360 [Chthoniobacter sp.]